MKISGIVCEYNPFHNGHLHHIAETRKNGADRIICVMSGNFVQRGDTAVLDKFRRADLAVRCGADLVLELPVQYCLSSAEFFAKGAVYILDSLGIADELSFGSECGDIAGLSETAYAAESAADSEKMPELMKKGYTYPRALSEILADISPDSAGIVSEPNNVLAVEYIRALKYFGSDIKPFTVKRSAVMHDSGEISGNMASASYIRGHMNEAELFVPPVWADALKGGTANIRNLERAILYRVRTASADEISEINDAGQDLAQRIYAAKNAASFGELLEAVKSKRFTMARIRRVLLSLLIGIKKSDMAEFPPYIRALALNEGGREILAAAKKKTALPWGTSLAKLSKKSAAAKRFAELESRAADIYALAFETPAAGGKEFTTGVKIRKNGEY